jgi:hypothetical protein
MKIFTIGFTKKSASRFFDGGDWSAYETRFLDLMRARRVEQTVAREIVADGCLLCSEDTPDHCHRRLVAEYLDRHWGGLDITHLG